MAGFLDNVFGIGAGKSTDNDDPPQNQNQNQNQNLDQDPANIDPNKQNNIDPNKSIWDNNTQDPAPDPTQKIEITQKPAEQTPAEKMQAHIDGLDLTNGIDADKIAEDMREGNTESFTTALNTVAGNAYSASMQQMNTLVETKIEKAVQEATDQTTASVNSNMAVSQMQQQLEFTKDPDIEPIAKAALAQAIKNGATVETAIGQVEKFFAKAAGNITKSMKPPLNSSGHPQFPEETDNKSGQAEHDGWLDVLTGKTN